MALFGLLGDQSDGSSSPLRGLLGVLGPSDPSAAYTGSLLKDPTTGQVDPAVINAFRQRALAAAANAFAEGGMPVPYRGGVPLLSTIGKAGAAAGTSGDSLIAARLQAAQQQQAIAQAGLSQGQLSLLHTLGPAYQALIDKGIQGGQGGASGTATPGTPASGGKPLTPANLAAQGGGGQVSPQQLYSFLTDNGAAKNEATAITSGMMAESGGNPNAEHDKAILAARGLPPGYGLFGDNGTNLTAMRKYAGVGPNDPVPWQQQALFALQSLRPGGIEAKAGAQINAAQSPEQLTDAQLAWLRPKDWNSGGGNRDQRLASTSDILNNPPYAQAPPAQTAAATPAPGTPGPVGGYGPGATGVYVPPGGKQAVDIQTGAPVNPATGQPAGLLNLPQVPNAAAQLAPNAPPPAAPGPQSLLTQPPPGQALSPAAQAIVAGMANAQRPGAQFAGPGAAEPPPPGPAPGPNLVPGGAMTAPPPQVTQGPPVPPSSLLQQPPPVPPAPPAPGAIGTGPKIGMPQSLLQQPPPAPAAGGAPGPQPAPGATPAPAGPQAAPGGPGAAVGPPPQLPPPPSQMPPMPNLPPPQATPQQMIAQGIAGISSLTGHPAPEFVQQLANMPTQLALEQGKAYINMVTQGMTERDKQQVAMIVQPYIAAAEAAAKLPYTATRVAPGGGVSLGAQPPAFYAPENKVGFNPASQRNEFVTVTKQADGTSKFSWSGIPAEPSAQEKAYGTGIGGEQAKNAPLAQPQPTPQPGAPAVPAYPGTQLAPNMMSKQPDYAEPQYTGNQLADNTKRWGEQNQAMAASVGIAQQAEQRMMNIANAFQQVQTGAFTTDRAAWNNALDTIFGQGGGGVLRTSTDPGQVYTALHETYRSTLSNLKALNPRFANAEFQGLSKMSENPDLPPAANLNMLAEDIAQVRQQRALATDWTEARIGNPQAGVAGKQDPEIYQTKWLNQNPLPPIVAGVKQELGIGKLAPPPANTGGHPPNGYRFDPRTNRIVPQ